MRGGVRFATYLAPNVRPVYEAVAESVGRALGAQRLKVVDELGDYDDIRAMARLAREAGLEGFGPLAGCEPSSDEEGSR